jgi:hypothetical protein
MSRNRFLPGNDGHGGGRPAGARTRLATKFLWDLLKEWEEHGPGVLRICRIEKPVEFMKVVASTLPKEFALETGALAELSDDDLAAHLLILKKLGTRAVESSERDIEEARDDTKH